MKRRFIAGAVCPNCRAVDRIVVETDAQTSRRSCVECDFVEELDTAANLSTPASIPGSRLLRSAPSTEDPIPTQTVRFVTPPSGINAPPATDEEKGQNHHSRKNTDEV